MNLWKRVHSWAQAIGRRPALESEMDAELKFHLEARAEDLVREGAPRDEAERRARLEFGGMERAKEECRDARGVNVVETLLQDLRYGLRTLAKNPGYSAIAILTLALGIGPNTAIFSLINGILLESLPYPHAERLVNVRGSYPRGAFVAMREQVRSLEVGTYAEGHEFNLTGQGEAQRLTGTYISAELFNILGARAEAGRTFTAGEDLAGQDSYVILSHALWQQRFNADPTVIGRMITLEGVSRQVVGVMPAEFRFPSSKSQVWIPLHNDAKSTPDYWAGDYMPVIGRLKPGATIPQAQTEIRLFQSHVGELFPWPMPKEWNASVTVEPLQSGMVADVKTRLLLLFGAVALVLLIACTNLANLTLSRAATRQKELAIRASMGAGRGRLIRQLLTESVLLASIGSIVGLALAFGGMQLLRQLLPADTPRLADVRMDWHVLAFTGALALLTGLIFGIAPALHASRAALADGLKSSGRGAATSVPQRLRSALVVAEVAFAVLLVIGAGLLMRSLYALSHVDPGFRAEQILTARITPNQTYCADAERCVAFYRALLDKVRAIPGVSGAALVNTLPLGGRVSKRSLELEGVTVQGGESAPLFWMNVVTPDYLGVMNVGVVEGRNFTATDAAGEPVAIVDSLTAKRFWPDGGAVGKHVRLLGDQDWRTVIGVTAEVKAFDMQHTAPDWIRGTVYVPYTAQATMENKQVPAGMTLAIRTAASDTRVAEAVRGAVASLNPEVPVSEVQTMGTVVSEAVSTPAATTSLFGIFAGVALLLGIVGIYGVLSFFVSRRTREIGIRIALGAQKRDVLWMVLKEGAKFSLTGIALGLAGAALLTQWLSSELYGISPLDPVTYAGVALVMLGVTLAASTIPTRRAMRVDPTIALRSE